MLPSAAQAAYDGWRSAILSISDATRLWEQDERSHHVAVIFYAAEMRRQADNVLIDLIAEGKVRFKVSYREVAAAMEVSRQSVHERYGAQVRAIIEELDDDRDLLTEM